MPFADEPITDLLRAWSAGDQSARDAVIEAVYLQLRVLANRCFDRENPGHTLQATAIVHETYLKLVKTDIPWEDRAHFLTTAARMMRRILIDHARTKHRGKRGGAAVDLSLDEALAVGSGNFEPLLELDCAMQRLEAFDPRKSRMVELFYYGGLTQVEIARVLDLAPITVLRELKLARAWLHSQLSVPE